MMKLEIAKSLRFPVITNHKKHGLTVLNMNFFMTNLKRLSNPFIIHGRIQIGFKRIEQTTKTHTTAKIL